MSINDLPQKYDVRRFPFMLQSYAGPSTPVMPVTETYVAIPPALQIRDDDGGVWTLGFDYDEREWRTGRLEYDIVRNGVKTGDFGRVIEYRVNSKGNRVVRIWGAEGWREWNGNQFV